MRKYLLPLLFVLCSCTQVHIVSASSVRIEGVGRYDFSNTNGTGATDLSGITYAGGTSYYAVSDKQPRIFELNIQLDTTPGKSLGAIKSATIVSNAHFPLKLFADDHRTPFPVGPDREGCAYDPTDKTIWVSDEGTSMKIHPPQFRHHALDDGRTLQPPITADSPGMSLFKYQRWNLSFESLTRRPDGSGYWSANEEALTCDGPRSTVEAGCLIRLIRFSPAFRPTAQFAYRVDPVPAPSAGRRWDHSGVSDLCALPDGSLLVLERACSLAGWRTRIYLADTGAATDVTGIPLAPARGAVPEFTLVHKTLLFGMSNFLLSASNYEGICMGPKLPDGSHAIILIADSNGGREQSLYALRVYMDK